VPVQTAGASDRTGFTDAPLTGIPTKWIISRVSGITKIDFSGARLETVRITAMKMAVRTTSTEKAWRSWPKVSFASGPG
jgi:hypothetical protein